MYASVLYTFFPCIYITYHCIFGMLVAGKHTGGVCSSIWYVLGFPVVRFTCGLEMAVTPEKFLVKIGGGVVAIRRQLPLRLAWAISVHKSQVLFMTWRAGTVNQYTQSGLLHWWKFEILNIMPLNFRMLFLKERNEDLLILTNFPQTTPCYISCSGSSPVMIPCSSTHVPYLMSQGMTLDCVEISLGRAFEDGQAYVALSRARSLQCMRVTDFQPSCVRAHAAVLEYYRSLRRMRRNFIQ